MAELSREKSGSAAHRVVTLSDGSVGYAEAIWLAPQCLVCHGKALTPEISAALTAAYPGDVATGFEVGDFRGVFWAELKPAPRD